MTALRLVPPAAGRAQALLGEQPTLTLMADASAPDSCCTARLVRHGGVWLGVVLDRSAFADRVRMGAVPRFFVGDASVVTVSGVARTRVLGRVGAVGTDVGNAISALLGPWASDDSVVVEITPEALEVVADEDHAGVVPRT